MAHFMHHERSFTEKPSGIVLLATISAVVGAMAAMLFTPKRGSEMRGTIADKTRRMKSKLGSKASDISDKASDTAENVKDKVAESATSTQDATKRLADIGKEKTDQAKTHKRNGR